MSQFKAPQPHDTVPAGSTSANLTPPIDIRRLQVLMSLHHLSPARLAERAGVAEILICWRLTVPGSIRWGELAAIAHVLRVAPSELVETRA